MTHLFRTIRAGASLGLALLLAACGGNAPRVGTTAAPVQTVNRTEIETIARLLEQGDRRMAKKRIHAALKRDPNNASLMLLRDSIERDPKDLLGSDSFAYTVRPGDTIAGLAGRFLGNRLKAYQLARYNGIERPAELMAGQVIRIPGEAPRPEPVRRAEKPSEPSAAEAAKPAPSRAAAAPPPAPARRNNPAAARQARSAGLAALNDGNPARAVGLLTRAAALDPGNPAIARDLDRARRINATVKSRQ